MKKSILILSFLSLSNYLFASEKYLLTSSQDLEEDNNFKIAIICPAKHDAIKSIYQGFIDTIIDSNINAYFKIYNAQENMEFIQDYAQEIVDKKFNLVFCIGLRPSLILKKVFDEKTCLIPAIVSAEDPLNNKLIDSFEGSSTNMIAVTAGNDMEEPIGILKDLMSLNEALLAYCPNVQLIKRKDMLQEVLKKSGINLTTIEIMTKEEIEQKVAQAFTSVKNHSRVLFLFKDNLLISNIEPIVELCNKSKVILFTFDLGSSDKGAAFSYSVDDYEVGKEAGLKAIEILKEKKEPWQIFSTIIKNVKLKINRQALEKQYRQYYINKLDRLLRFLEIVEVS